ncbi:MAG: competence/damage-inducible protein A [Anaerolineae bacterium]
MGKQELWEQLTTVEIVAVGNELLLGDVLDTNTNWLCRKITGMGGQVRRTVMVRDELRAISREIEAALGHGTDLIITTGGLGPTADDLTLSAVAEATGQPLELNPLARDLVASRYWELARLGHVADGALTEARQKMAILPRGAQPLANLVGTAPAVLLEIGRSRIVCLPGVPAELKGIFEGSLQPLLEEIFGQSFFSEKLLMIDCGDESVLASILEEVAGEHPEVYIKSRAKGFGAEVKFRVTLSASGRSWAQVEGLISQALHDLEVALRRAHIVVESVEEVL